MQTLLQLIWGRFRFVARGATNSAYLLEGSDHRDCTVSTSAPAAAPSINCWSLGTARVSVLGIDLDPCLLHDGRRIARAGS